MPHVGAPLKGGAGHGALTWAPSLTASPSSKPRVRMGSTLEQDTMLTPIGDWTGLDVQCVMLGGSTAYGYERDLAAAKDWDGVVIVSNKKDIPKLINDNRASFCRMLSIAQEEHPCLQVPGPTHPLWSKFDGVRFVGWTAKK